MDREVVKELIQHALNTTSLKKELNSIIAGGLKRRQLKDDYKLLKEKLGKGGASENTAKLIIATLQKEN